MTARIVLFSLICLALPVSANVMDGGGCQLLHQHALDGNSGFNFESSRAAPIAPDGEAFVVRNIRIVRLPIFDLSDPDEDKWLYRAANRVHRPTRESAVRDALVFREGDTATAEMLEESERVLRSKLYVHDARVLPRRRCGNEVDVDVVTRDLWTLVPRLILARRGGENRLGIGFGDSNFLGTGKAIGVSYEKSVDREGYSVGYDDPNVLGSRIRLTTNFTINDDGERHYVDLRRPFYSMDARYAWGLRMNRVDGSEDLYFRGDSFAGFRQRLRFWETSGGLSRGRGGDGTTRVRFGVTYEDETFTPEAGEVAPAPFPVDRTLVFPWVGLEMVEDAFERTSSFQRIGVTEDVFVGRRMSARIGWSSRSFGADIDRAVFDATYGDAFWVGENGYFRYRASVDGYWNRDDAKLENTYASVGASFHLSQSPQLAMFSSADFTYTRGLTADRQLFLGGETGLRGYPLRFQVGDRSWRFSFEERYFTDLHLFNIFRVGAAAFFDVGRAWFPGDSSSGEYAVLADVGVGLRLESTRTQSGRIHHLDFALPLRDGDNVDGFQVVLTVRGTL
jgi:hypothetical protein